MRITGVVRRLVPEKGWGICVRYQDSQGEPEKYFVHVSKFADPEDFKKVQLGSYLSFVVGPPRLATERPAALEIELASHPGQEMLAQGLPKSSKAGAL